MHKASHIRFIEDGKALIVESFAIKKKTGLLQLK
jgi:hypothetical protein